jgi:mono/diheme cytochrome c family protein
LKGLLLGSALSAACAQQMAQQPYHKPFETSAFFADHSSARPLVNGTVPRNAPSQDATPMVAASLTEATLRRGRERFNIYCAVCHGLAGDGDGIVPERGLSPPPSFHTERLRAAPASHFFDVMTQGYGAMPSYANQISVADRWAIYAYVRALQLSQHAGLAAAPPAVRAQLERGGAQ